MVIQRAKKEEVHEIKKLLTETWINTYNEIYSPDTIKNITSQWHKPELLIVQIQDPDVYFGLAKEQDKIVGLITVRRENNDNLTMYRLYIHPNFQRQGIGTKLIQEALKVFKGCKKLNIEVEQQNMKGVSFYRKQGFKEIGRKTEKVGNDEVFTVKMEKDIYN